MARKLWLNHIREDNISLESRGRESKKYSWTIFLSLLYITKLYFIYLMVPCIVNYEIANFIIIKALTKIFDKSTLYVELNRIFVYNQRIIIQKKEITFTNNRLSKFFEFSLSLIPSIFPPIKHNCQLIPTNPSILRFISYYISYSSSRVHSYSRGIIWTWAKLSGRISRVDLARSTGSSASGGQERLHFRDWRQFPKRQFENQPRSTKGFIGRGPKYRSIALGRVYIALYLDAW